eukprot:1155047-Pelagomonas_calceolata.AAC.1
MSGREAFESAVTDQDAERACTCLKSWIFNAARHPNVCVIALRPRSQQMVRNVNYRRPEWFNDVCAARKKAFSILEHLFASAKLPV